MDLCIGRQSWNLSTGRGPNPDEGASHLIVFMQTQTWKRLLVDLFLYSDSEHGSALQTSLNNSSVCFFVLLTTHWKNPVQEPSALPLGAGLSGPGLLKPLRRSHTGSQERFKWICFLNCGSSPTPATWKPTLQKPSACACCTPSCPSPSLPGCIGKEEGGTEQ